MNKNVSVPTSYAMDPGDELNDLRMSDKARPLFDHVNKFIRETVEPMSVEFYRLGEKKVDRWSFAPGQLDVALFRSLKPGGPTAQLLGNLQRTPCPGLGLAAHFVQP